MCERVWNEGVHLGHFRSGAIDENDQLAITMDTVVRFGLEFPFSPRRLWRNGDKTRTTSVKCSASTRSGTEPMWGGPVAALASSHRQQFGRHVSACSGQIHALPSSPRETHAPPSSWCRPLALFCQTSSPVAAPSFRKATTSTSPRCGRRWWRAFLRGILNCVGIRGWRRIYGLRKLSAV